MQMPCKNDSEGPDGGGRANHPVDLSALLLGCDQSSRGEGRIRQYCRTLPGRARVFLVTGDWCLVTDSGQPQATSHQSPACANHSLLRRDQSPVTVELLTIRQAIEGDETALRALWARHAPHIDLVVRRLVGQDHDLAADIAQEVWIQIFRALPSYRGDSQFGTWAHRIAVNRTLNALRKTRRLANLETEVEEDSASVEMDTDRSFLAASIEEAMGKLSPGARAVFVLHDVEGFTHEEIARDLGITAGGSKSQLFKARAKLRKLLAHLVDRADGQKSRTDSGHVAPA